MSTVHNYKRDDENVFDKTDVKIFDCLPDCERTLCFCIPITVRIRKAKLVSTAISLIELAPDSLSQFIIHRDIRAPLIKINRPELLLGN